MDRERITNPLRRRITRGNATVDIENIDRLARQLEYDVDGRVLLRQRYDRTDLPNIAWTAAFIDTMPDGQMFRAEMLLPSVDTSNSPVFLAPSITLARLYHHLAMSHRYDIFSIKGAQDEFSLVTYMDDTPAQISCQLVVDDENIAHLLQLTAPLTRGSTQQTTDRLYDCFALFAAMHDFSVRQVYPADSQQSSPTITMMVKS